MAKKLIAAVLLVGITAWAEMTLAPMLAMHAGHMRAGHETVADMAVAPSGHNHAAHMHSHAAHHHSGDQHSSDQQSAQPSAKNSQDAEEATGGKPCCPGLHKSVPAVLLVVAEEAPACDSHSCCFRQGPQSVPAQARDAQTLTRELVAAPAPQAGPGLEATRNDSGDRVETLRHPPNLLSMTLRV